MGEIFAVKSENQRKAYSNIETAKPTDTHDCDLLTIMQEQKTAIAHLIRIVYTLQERFGVLVESVDGLNTEISDIAENIYTIKDNMNPSESRAVEPKTTTTIENFPERVIINTATPRPKPSALSRVPSTLSRVKKP
jgi:hypothetical protein